MIGLNSPLRGHKKESSTDSLSSLNSQRRRKFLSVVSSEPPMPPAPKAPVQHLRKISELKKQAMGEATNRTELKIKRASVNLSEKPAGEKGVTQRMVQFKKRLTMLGDGGEWGCQKQNAGPSGAGQGGLQTPINRLLFESTTDEPQ